MKTPFLIGVAGGTAAGKSTVCEGIMDAVKRKSRDTDCQIISLSQNSFYKTLSSENSLLAQKGEFDFDHPDAYDNAHLLSCLKDIQAGKPTQIPVYDFKTNSPSATDTRLINPSDVVLFEGILVFYNKEVRDMFHMKLFVDTDADTRLARRVLRDIEEHGRELDQILLQYTTSVKPAFEDFCLPTKKFADVVIPRGADNTVAIELLAQQIQDIISTNNCSSMPGSPFSRSRSNSDSIIRK